MYGNVLNILICLDGLPSSNDRVDNTNTVEELRSTKVQCPDLNLAVFQNLIQFLNKK